MKPSQSWNAVPPVAECASIKRNLKMGQRQPQHGYLPGKQRIRTKETERCFGEVKSSPCKIINTPFVTGLLKQRTLDCHAFVVRPGLTDVSTKTGQIATDTTPRSEAHPRPRSLSQTPLVRLRRLASS